MDILKYFYEEPASLEVLSADLDADARRQTVPALSLEAFLQQKRYFRGYLAGTNQATQQVGVTALGNCEAYSQPLLHVFAGCVWTHRAADGTVSACTAAEVAHHLAHPEQTTLLVGAAQPLPAGALLGLLDAERRYILPALRRLLDQTTVACFPEPAHHGFDWSLFSASPMRQALEAAFRAHALPNVRRFSIPFRKARSEEKFYFEAHLMDQFVAYEIT